MKRTSTLTRAFAICALLSSICIFAACGGKKAAAQYRIVLGNTQDIFINPAILNAQARGYFAEYGLEVAQQPTEVNMSTEFLSSGKFDALTTGITVPLTTGAQGGDVVLFGGSQSGGVVFFGRAEDAERLRDPANWHGLTFATEPGSTTNIITRWALENTYGFDLTKDIDIHYFDTREASISAVSKKFADFNGTSPEFIELAQAQGLVQLFPITDLVPDNVCCRQTANGTCLTNNRAAFVAYLKAQLRGFKDYKTDRAGSTKILAKATKQDEDYVTRAIYDKASNANRDYNPDPNYNGTLGFYETILKNGMVVSDRPLHEFFDISVYADALKEIIKDYPDEPFYREQWAYFVAHNDKYPGFYDTYPQEL